jgi:hypothetical protein
MRSPYRWQVNLSGAPLIIVDNCYRAFAGQQEIDRHDWHHPYPFRKIETPMDRKHLLRLDTQLSPSVRNAPPFISFCFLSFGERRRKKKPCAISPNDITGRIAFGYSVPTIMQIFYPITYDIVDVSPTLASS